MKAGEQGAGRWRRRYWWLRTSRNCASWCVPTWNGPASRCCRRDRARTRSAWLCRRGPGWGALASALPTSPRGGRAGAAGDEGLVGYGGGVLVIDEPRRAAEVRGTPVDLTPTEWGILVALATVPGRVYSRLELINRVRGYEFEGYERTIDSHVKNLRHKIEEDQREPQIIQTVLGGGYRLGPTPDGYVRPPRFYPA